MMLHIPLRARLNPSREPPRPEFRPAGGFLCDQPQPKLPPLPRRCYGRSPGRQSKNV